MKHRLQLPLLYLGWAPFAPWARSARQNALFEHHYRQALSLQFLLLCVALVFALFFVSLSITLVYFRSFYEGASFEPRLMNLFRKIFLAWLVFYAYGLGSALLGARPEMPLVSWLSRSHRLRRFTIGAFLSLYALIAIAAPFTAHAAIITRNDLAPAPVYLLYDDVNRYPRAMFTLAFYRMSMAGRDRFGKDAVVAAKLSEDSLKAAMANARFIFIASHGKARGIILEGGWLEPHEVDAWPTNPALEFVYLAGCDSGAIAGQWEAAFSPAEVKTYDRLSAVLEHLWWMWSQGPGVIRAIPKAGEIQPADDGGTTLPLAP
jgi:hypothetical protein